MLGEAEGDVVRSRSVPPTRSLRSVQPASTEAPSARTQKPVSNFFIVVLLMGFDPRGRAAMGGPPARRLRYAERLAVGYSRPSAEDATPCEGEFTMKLEGSYDIPVPRE